MIRNVYCGKGFKQAAFDIEFSGKEIGILLRRDSGNAITSIAGITRPDVKEEYPQIKIGSVLITVNQKNVVYDDFDDVINLLILLRDTEETRILRFLDISLCALDEFIEKMSLEYENHKDRYGFLQSLGSHKFEKKFAKINHRELLARDVAWIEYLKRSGGPCNLKPSGAYPPSAELKALVRQGISPAFRGKIWPFISLSNRKRLGFPREYFNSLLEASSDAANTSVKYEISKDVPRTFAKHFYFHGKAGQESLWRVLVAYAVHNPSVGYCQSMNFIAGLMILFMGEEDAFWLLLTVIEDIFPPQSYNKTMLDFHVDMYIVYTLLEQYAPKVWQMFNSEEASYKLSSCIMPWFMCLFINTLPSESLLRVWDAFLNEGKEILFRVALALLRINEDKIVDSGDVDDALMVIKELGRSVCDPSKLFEVAFDLNLFSSAYYEKVGSQCCIDHSDVYKFHSVVPKSLEGIGLAHIGPSKNLKTLTFPILGTIHKSPVTDEAFVVSPNLRNHIDKNFESLIIYYPSPSHLLLTVNHKFLINNSCVGAHKSFQETIEELRRHYTTQLNNNHSTTRTNTSSTPCTEGSLVASNVADEKIKF